MVKAGRRLNKKNGNKEKDQLFLPQLLQIKENSVNPTAYINSYMRDIFVWFLGENESHLAHILSRA